MKVITVHLEKDEHTFLKEFSEVKTGRENVSAAIRILIKEEKQRRLNEIEIVQAKTVK